MCHNGSNFSLSLITNDSNFLLVPFLKKDMKAYYLTVEISKWSKFYWRLK